jgi:glucose/arabinose dehydrogenase
MAKKPFFYRATLFVIALALLISVGPGGPAAAQEEGPLLLDPALGVRTVAEGLTTPIGVAFLNEEEWFVLEKNTGQVLHFARDEMQGVALDLGVNFASERGLLGIALDPDFEDNGYVYLYWTCSSPAPTDSPYFPSEIECADEPQLGEDTDDILSVPLLGNRVDRFVWDGTALTWDMNLIKLRAFQNDGAPIPRGQGDEEQPPRGNHNGGVIRFGTDGKLYIIFGDNGRRGVMQNLPLGPGVNETEPQAQLPLVQGEDQVTVPDEALPLDPMAPSVNKRATADDQFGGPFPDDAHYTGVIVRLNNDGSIPSDNPFYKVGARIGGEIGENLQKTYAYGIRNSFGMAVDPQTGNLWISENGEDAYDELNLVQPGFNSGWIQIMGPVEDVADYKEIETTSLHFEDFPNLQQFRWSPENIADTPEEALSRLFWLRGSQYSDPEFSWEFAVAPAAIGFVDGDGLGEEYHGDLFAGLSVPLPLGGPLFRYDLSSNRTRFSGLDSIEAENEDFNSLIGSEELLIGTNFGVATDIETGPNGSLFVVSISNGAVYEIFRETEDSTAHFSATLTGDAEVPGPGDPEGRGESHVYLNSEQGEVCFVIVATDLTTPTTAAHIHVGEEDVAGDVVVPLAPPDEGGASAGCVSGVEGSLIDDIVDNPSGYYVNVHTEEFPAGAVRGQLSE